MTQRAPVSSSTGSRYTVHVTGSKHIFVTKLLNRGLLMQIASLSTRAEILQTCNIGSQLICSPVTLDLMYIVAADGAFQQQHRGEMQPSADTEQHSPGRRWFQLSSVLHRCRPQLYQLACCHSWLGCSNIWLCSLPAKLHVQLARLQPS